MRGMYVVYNRRVCVRARKDCVYIAVDLCQVITNVHGMCYYIHDMHVNETVQL